MSLVLKAIQKWASTQPMWQQEAAVRLFETGELAASDDDDLFALLKSAHGIEDPQKRKARIFSADLAVQILGASSLSGELVSNPYRLLPRKFPLLHRVPSTAG